MSCAIFFVFRGNRLLKCPFSPSLRYPPNLKRLSYFCNSFTHFMLVEIELLHKALHFIDNQLVSYNDVFWKKSTIEERGQSPQTLVSWHIYFLEGYWCAETTSQGWKPFFLITFLLTWYKFGIIPSRWLFPFFLITFPNWVTWIAS